MRSTQKAARLVTLSVLCLIMVACKSPNPTPEVLDPIFADLNARAAQAKAAAEGAKEEVAQLRIDLAALPARDPSRRKVLQDISKKELHLVVAEQDALYFEIRARQRKDYARSEYLRAFHEGKDWPDPKAYESYKLQRKLAESPREWNNRVPRTGRYNKPKDAELRQEFEEQMKATKPPGGH